jgi:hypothetical protein
MEMQADREEDEAASPAQKGYECCRNKAVQPLVAWTVIKRLLEATIDPTVDRREK